MKHADEAPVPIESKKIQAALRETGVSVSDVQAEALAQHAREVLRASARMNVTAIKDAEDFVKLHVVDSLLPLAVVERCPDGPMIDIGSGGGFPGIPLAIATGRRCVLLDAVQKKAKLLENIAGALNLSHVSVVGLRAEECARTNAEGFAVAVVRGVGELATIVELAAPLLQMGGRLVAYKGRPSREEIERGDRAAALAGLDRIADHRYALPTGEQRAVLVYEKVSAPRVALPRRPGMAAKRPLG
ncbi:16S rRNA 7-methylguanosine methyltransferase [Coriobacteriaceae bacterium EMTCatB1]|nr:16S rRNA 7-methylguanosine methyltransferase [Coriobacteriaceae bacterium EMTCatB1]